MIYIHKLKILSVMWMKNNLWNRQVKLYEVIENVQSLTILTGQKTQHSLSTMISKKQANYAPGGTGPKLISLSNKKSFKWGQYLSVT